MSKAKHTSPFASDRPQWGKGTFAGQLSGNRQFKDDNKDEGLPVKLQLRQEALAAVRDSGAEPAVLDCFAGRGKMWGHVWNQAATYLGTDQSQEQALAHPGRCLHAEAEKVMRTFDLSGFNIFDFDAYGSPWNEVLLLTRRRRLAPGETIAVCITDGSQRRAMLGLTSYAMAELAGVDPRAAGAHQRWDELVRAAMTSAARRMGGELVALRKTASGLWFRGVYYGAAVMRGLPQGAQPQPEAPQGAGAAEGQGPGAEAPQGQPPGAQAAPGGAEAPQPGQGPAEGQGAPQAPRRRGRGAQAAPGAQGQA